MGSPATATDLGASPAIFSPFKRHHSSGPSLDSAASKKRTRQPPSPGIAQYHIEVVQGPVKARMTGFGEKDRRPIDPPIVVRMTCLDETGQAAPASSIRLASLACQTQIYAPDRVTSCAHVYYPSAIQQATRGAIASGALRGSSGSSSSTTSFGTPTSSQTQTQTAQAGGGASASGSGDISGRTSPLIEGSTPHAFDYALSDPASAEPALQWSDAMHFSSTVMSASATSPATSRSSSSGSSHSTSLGQNYDRLDGPPLPSFDPLHNILPTDPTLYAGLQKSRADSTDIGALGGAKQGGEDENEDEHEDEAEGVKSVATSTPTLQEHLLPSAAGTRTRNLLGGLTASAHLLKNEHDDLGIYFVFLDLAVRAEGHFVLHFELLDLDDAMSSQGACVLAHCYSCPFRVYSAKVFPGMSKSTELTKAFSKQGIKVVVRKKVSATTAAPDSGDESGDNST